MFRVRAKLSLPLMLCVTVCIPLMYFTLGQQLDKLNAEYVGRIGDNTITEVETAIQAAEGDARALTSLFTQSVHVREAYALALSGDINDENDPSVQKAREMLRASLLDALMSYEAANGVRLKLHFHLPNSRSLVRLWQPKNFRRNGVDMDVSDDLASFRGTVVDVNRTGKPAEGLEVGRGGFDVRCVLPVRGQNGQQLGSAEVLMEFNGILRAVNTRSERVYVFMNRDLLSVAQQLGDENKHPRSGEFVMVNTPKQENWKEFVKPSLLDAGRKGRVVDTHDSYSTIYAPLYDYKNSQIGVIASVVDTHNEAMLRESMLYRLLGITALMLVLILSMAHVATSLAVMRPLKELLRYSRAVASGDLTVTAAIKTCDEFQALMECVCSMVDMLKTKIAEAVRMTETARQESEAARRATADAEDARAHAELARAAGMTHAAEQLESVVAVLSSASTQLAAQIVQSERGCGQQAGRVTETATAMDAMNATVLEVARNAGAASEASAQTRRKAQTGSQVVRHVVDSIHAVHEQSLRLKKDMVALDESARDISRIMVVISDIADQTNLLALNAAIEAARAGDAGRGFAVVADEVRKLAEKTQHATADVGKAIQSIQGSAAQSAAQVEAAVGYIEKATDYAGQSGAALEEIVQMMDGTADQVRAIATAAEQQSSTSEAIHRSITDVRQVSDETAAAMRDAARAVDALATQARCLQELIADLKRG